MALIVKNRRNTKLKEEIEKIEIIRGHDQIYQIDHAVTKTQKVILKVFGMDAAYVKPRANRDSEQIKIVDNIGR